MSMLPSLLNSVTGYNHAKCIMLLIDNHLADCHVIGLMRFACQPMQGYMQRSVSFFYRTQFASLGAQMLSGCRFRQHLSTVPARRARKRSAPVPVAPATGRVPSPSARGRSGTTGRGPERMAMWLQPATPMAGGRAGMHCQLQVGIWTCFAA